MKFTSSTYVIDDVLVVSPRACISNMSLNLFSHQPNTSGSTTVTDTPTRKPAEGMEISERSEKNVYFIFADGLLSCQGICQYSVVARIRRDQYR